MGWERARRSPIIHPSLDGPDLYISLQLSLTLTNLSFQPTAFAVVNYRPVLELDGETVE